jgi:hypothetical protein
MIRTGFEKRVKVQQIIESQLPEFILSESPKAVDFLKQYYISQEYQGGPTDFSDNLDQYLKIDNLTPEVISGSSTLSSDITTTSEVGTIEVSSTKGFPSQYGLFKIDDEIFTYTGLTTNTFTGCVRGFSGITSYRTDLNSEELIFSESSAATHSSGKNVENLSVGFLKEFYKKLKYAYAPGLEDLKFTSDLSVNNFIKESRSLYESKGTEESFKILFKVLYGVDAKVIDLEDYLVKPSSANYRRREVIVAKSISGEPNNLIGQTITKSSDSSTTASVSEVEIFTRPGFGTYYKIGLFVGFDDRDLIEGTFGVQAESKVINAVPAGSSVITVDSTIGFSDSGTIISGDNTITYTSKSVNQFLGCSGIETAIAVKDNVRTNEYYFGYENGDTSKEVRIRITGVLSEFKTNGNVDSLLEGQKIYVNNVGEKILNPTEDKTDKEIFANSWIYNTSSRFDVDSINESGTVYTLKSNVDKSSLKVGDLVDVLSGTTETVKHSNATVSGIFGTSVELINCGFTTTAPTTLRRKLNTFSSSEVPTLHGNNVLVSDLQNLYTDSDFVYAASNSLPSYEVDKDIVKSTIPTASGSYLQGFSDTSLKYSILSFDNDVDFITGDEVYYTYSSSALNGLSEGYYYVEVLTLKNKIKLYASGNLIASGTNVEFSSDSSVGTHTFTLSSQKSGIIHPQNLLKKFPLVRNIQNGNGTLTTPSSTGMLVNGVEIINYKSTDKIYYGPLNDITIYNGGEDYDVVSTPTIEISSPASGYTTSLVQPVVRGVVQEVKVDPQKFDLQDVLSVSISGGNGDGAILEPVLETRYREIEFDARLTGNGGGLNNTSDTITFTEEHNLSDGEPIVYLKNNNVPLGIGTFGGENTNQSLNLSDQSVYYANVVDTTTIKLYKSFNNYSSGINTVGFTTTSGGVHKFRLFKGKKTLKEIRVINSGSGYENRNLKVKPENVSTTDNSITFENHGFNDGDVVTYSTDGSAAGGLSTSVRYKIIKLSDDKFRVANVGVAATDNTNYVKKIPVDITSSGSGYQNFSYPNIEVTVNAVYDGVSGTITATPIVRGEIVDLYLYEKGTGYGSDILNFQNNPELTIKTGKGGELLPVISNGRITSVYIETPGSEFSSAPDLEVVGDGVGAELRAVVSGGKITSVVVLNSGFGYNPNSTSIKVKPVGKNAHLQPHVRGLTLNNHYRFGDEVLTDNNNLQYGFVGYSTSIGESEFGDDGTKHSPIIGWAYDGNPIYGGYGYSDPANSDSNIKILTSGYTESLSNIEDRPSSTKFPLGFFVEDYKFAYSSDLDEYNGRYAKTPDYPNGVYAYYATINTSGNKSVFPYFIGNKYRSLPTEQDLDQTYDFNNSNLVRNTFPYSVDNQYSNNDFITESYEYLVQTAVIDSVTKGSVDGFIINESGSKYKVGDSLTFDNTDTNGGGLTAEVKSVTGKDIVDVTTTTLTYNSNVLVWNNSKEVTVHVSPSHEYSNGDSISISGLSTFVSNLTKTHKIGVTTESTQLIVEVPANSTAGIVTDIFVVDIPSSVSAGTTIGIGTEVLSVLSTYPQNNVIRVVRGVAGSAHETYTNVNVSVNNFTLPVSTQYFDSQLDDKIYFNPVQAVGIGSTSGNSSSNSYFIGDRYKTVSVDTQNIYLPGHPFKTGQQVTFEKPNSSNSITVASTETSASYTIPESGNTQTFFVIKNSDDFIGLCTQVGLTTNTKGLYFRSFTTNGDTSDYRYSITSNKTQVTANASRITARVSVSTSHALSNSDQIKLSLTPQQSVGIGTSTAVRVKYNSTYDKLLVDTIGFTSTSVNSSTNEISITEHGLKTGDRVFYDSTDLVVSGLSTGSYFIYRKDDNTINLTESYYDATSKPPTVVSFASTGGSDQEISLINPLLNPTKGNNLVFDVSDSSLSGYELKFYCDREFKNELVSIGSSTVFNVSGFGTVGVSTNATVTLNYENTIPSIIYYQLNKSNFISTSDTEVKNYSEISFKQSEYEGSYNVVGVGTTTFDISLKNAPENSNYTQSTTSVLKYSTTSQTAIGGVSDVKLVYGGANYKRLPEFVSIASTIGENADIIPTSKTIGKINQYEIKDLGFDFSADKTLSPEAYISPNITLKNRNYISDIEIVSGGSGYVAKPDLVIVNPTTGVVYDSGSLTASIQGSSITSVEIIESPVGLSEVKSEIYAVNNSNGVGINRCTTSSSGIVTCVLSTPLNGFTAATAPFAQGDFVFVEGVSLATTTGTGFNSEDYSYKFFEVVAYRNTNPAEVEYDVSPHTTNPGLAHTSQGSFATIINKDVYPTINPIQKPSEFIVGEKLSRKVGNDLQKVDLEITNTLNDSIKVFGTYSPKVGDIIVGRESGSQATINSIVENKGRFTIDYSLITDYGWSNAVGNLSEDYQVIPDNDYYQNLSYSVSSPITYDDWVNPVNSILHSTGLKNFSDTGITSEAKVSIGQTGSSSSAAVIDLINEKRVDTINIFDFGTDIRSQTNTSKFVKLQSKKLSDYIECRTNRVLIIDNFNSLFSNKEDANSTLYKDINTLSSLSGYSRYLIQVINPNTSDVQATELVTLNTNLDNLIVGEKTSLYSTDDPLGSFEIYEDTLENSFLRFTPEDPYDSDFNIKFIKTDFNTTLAGVGTTSIGFVDLIGFNSTVGFGSTTTIYEKSTDEFECIIATVELVNTVSKQKTLVDLFVDHDGTRSEFFLDGLDNSQFSSNFIGTFTSNVDSGTFTLKYENDTDQNDVRVRSSIVGFGTTSVGIGTHTFKASGQPDDSVREGRLETNYSIVPSSGITTVLTYTSTDVTTVKSISKVSYGNTSSIHQILFNHDGTDTYVTQYPYLTINDNLGIGTFGAEISGSDFNLIFYPDSGINDDITVQSYSEIIQTDRDLDNVPATLTHGTVNQNLITTQFDSINGDRTNKTEFNLNYKGTPIFEKTFDPSVAISTTTGLFTISDHFFNTGERLTYTPRSSFIGVSATSIVMSDTNVLPTDVYVIKENKDQFKLATSLSNANAGTAVTFNSVGDGNAHTLEMYTKLEKSLITIDGIIRSPLAYTPITHTLSDSISVGTTYLSVSGISSILPGDTIKIENEFIKAVSVGIGTTTDGPISGTGSYNLIESERGFVGTSATSHNSGSTLRVYTGSYNIVRNQIHFTEAPRGNVQELVDESNIPYYKSSFSGRVYLRKDYSTNKIYDDISREFTGIGATYTLTVEGSNITGIETGSGLVYINNMFQNPTTTNNVNGNYNISESSGISSVIFSGVDDASFISDYDVNQNLLPRGGLIVSLGSTQGLGFAPLVGASVTAVVGAGGSIVSVGLGTTDNLGSGYYGSVSIGITDSNHSGDPAIITATVGAGGTLSFVVSNDGGTGYTTSTTIIEIPDPSYSNLEIVGTSRLGIGATTDTGSGLLLNVEVGAANTNVGIGSTLFEVKEFKITRPGYGFKIGDKFKPVGLVTAKNLSAPIDDFELEVLDVFYDRFLGFQFGELDYIDSIASLQDGVRKRFPLNYNDELLSFEIDRNNQDSAEIELENLLLVYINGVLQNPGETYTFEGGTSIVFVEAPRGVQLLDPEQQLGDNIQILFYRGTRNDDSLLVTTEKETIKPGDFIQLSAVDDTAQQDERVGFNIYTSDELETNPYSGPGIEDDTFRPFSWTKQKDDKVIGGEVIHKTRDSIEGQVYPTARIIGDFSTTDTEIFVDNAKFFDYEGDVSGSTIDALIVNTTIDPVAAAITATVSAGGTVSALTIDDGGSGYTGSSAIISISAPSRVKVGVGTTATATATVTNGSITSVSITDGGLGYATATPPQVITTLPNVSIENILNMSSIVGTSGSITGIGTTTGTDGNDLAIKFDLYDEDSFSGLSEGYPIYIFNTRVGSGVTSINGSDSSTVGIGTTFLDNIYIVNSLYTDGTSGVATCNILSTTDHSSISDTAGAGLFSWGRISGFTRSSSPISIGVTGLTIDSGLSTFPTIQRRGHGLRSTGSLKKDLS